MGKVADFTDNQSEIQRTDAQREEGIGSRMGGHPLEQCALELVKLSLQNLNLGELLLDQEGSGTAQRQTD